MIKPTVVRAVGTDMAGGVLVVTIDRLPAWILPAYGSTWVATPALDRLAAGGLVLDRVIATTTDPVATLAAIAGGAGGLLGAGAACGAGWTVVTDDAAALPADLAAVARRVEVSAPARADVADEPEETVLGRLMAAAIAAVQAAAHAGVWCHATSLGKVWDAPEGFRDAYVDPDDPPPPGGATVPGFRVTAETDPDLLAGVRHLFAGQVTLLDHALAPLLAAVPADWCVVVCGLRGLALGLHGAVGPGADAPFGEIVQLPAILREPGGRWAGQRESVLAVPADLGATVAGLLGGGGGTPAGPWEGRDLAPVLTTGAPPRDRVLVHGRGGPAVTTAAWHLVAGGTEGGEGPARAPRLFAKPDDFFEVSDVADRSPSVAEELTALLQGFSGDPVSPGPADRRAWLEPLSAAATGRGDGDEGV